MPVEVNISTALLLGLLLGMKHALDADHVVAMMTIVSRNRSLLRTAVEGLVWSMGHNFVLFAVGFGVLFLKLSIPDRFALSVELAVGLLLVVLGAPLLWRVMVGKAHVHLHQHGTKSHFHVHSHLHALGHDHAHLRKPLFIGMLQGLAGSGALTLLALNIMPSLAQGILFLTIFSLGIMSAMVVLSGLISFPFRLAASLSVRVNRWAQGVAGLTSMVLGLLIIWQTGFSSGLFG